MKKKKKTVEPSDEDVKDTDDIEVEVVEPEVVDPKKDNDDSKEEKIKKKSKKRDKKKDISEEEILIKEVEILENELTALKQDVLKSRADAENFKKRLQRDHDLSQKYRIQTFALDILPALDNLERAMEEESKDTALLEGVEMIYKQLKTSLEVEGVKAIKALDSEFDPNLHQAISTKKVEGVKENIVLEEYQKGYMIKDRILRPSIVIVSE